MRLFVRARPGGGEWIGPQAPAPLTIEKLPFQDASARLVRTPHYKIYTTVEDTDFITRVGQLMEGGLFAYQTLAPDVPLTDQPMECYLFSRRSQWVEFTKQHTGLVASVYLQINRGGYTLHDWYVAYYIGEGATCSVAAHEGWHQFVARHFKGRLPPFIEEGLATMFEGVEFQHDLPRFNLSVNQTRAIALRKAIEDKQLWPLEQVVAMHAGQVVDKSGGKIEAFYAQAWAFGRFLWEADNAKYRPALRRLLADTASGEVFDPTGSHKDRNLPWNPDGVKPMLEHYLGMSFDEIDAAYAKYIQKIAFEELQAQSNSTGYSAAKKEIFLGRSLTPGYIGANAQVDG